MNCLVGFVVLIICLAVVISYPTAFMFLLALAVIVWVVRWASKQASDTSPGSRTTTSHPPGTTKSSANVSVTHSVRDQNPAPSRSAPPTVRESASTSLRWMGQGDQISVGNYVIADPLTYCASGRTTVSDASCIRYDLKVGVRVDEPKGALGYWPEYSRMTPNQRANYLHWMASGRKAPLNDIGYVFIFFYGLERRVLVDGADVRPIVTEVLRLLSTYSFSGSFNSYASNFLAYIAAKGGTDRLAENWFNTLAEPFFRIGGDPMSFALAWLHMHQRPLSPKLAYLLALHDVRFPNSVVVQRLPEQFGQLFAKKYTEVFADGLLLRCAKRPLRLFYHTATASFGSSLHLTPVEVPNVLGIPSQFNKLIDIWTACIEELKPLSRKLAKGIDVNTREAYNALPELLRAEVDHPDKPQWDMVVNGHMVKDGLALLQVSDIAAIGGLTPQTRLTAKQSAELAETANHVGYVIVPDFRITGLAYKWADIVGLFRPDGKPMLPTDGSYKPAARMLELGVAVAAADGKITRNEIEHITEFLEAEFDLSPDHLRRLEAYREVLMIRPPAIKPMASQLKAVLSKEQLTMLCRFLVGVAAADGSVPKDEIKLLRSAYTALGVDEADLFVLLSEISASSDSPVEIAKATSTKLGEPIPSMANAADEPVITIDHDRVRRLIDETKEVSRMLGEAMQEIYPENEPILSVSGPGVTADLTERDNAAVTAKGYLSLVPSDVLAQLDGRYHKLLDLLLASDEWTRDEFDSLVRQHGLMPSSTVEMINSWADEHLGDFLIDEAGSLCVNRQILGG